MGWWKNRKMQKRLQTFENAVNALKQFSAKDWSQYQGKDAAELAREGGWDVVAGTDWSWLGEAWQSAGGIWKHYTTRDMEILYSVASAIHACIRVKCINANQVFMEVGKHTTKGWVGYDNHPFYKLMRRPNGGQDRTTFYWDLVSHVDCTGESYVWKIRNRGGEIIAMQPLPTSWITPEYDSRTNELLYYGLRKGSSLEDEIRIRPEDMFIIRYPNPNDPTGASGPLQAALKDLQIDDARADLLVEMLTNIHFPGAILKSEHRLTAKQKQEAREKFMDLVGAGKRANPLIADGTINEIELPKPPSDMDWPGTAIQAETRICAAFGVPPIMIHLRSGLEHGTYSNYEQARKAFYQDTMRSLWLLIADALERGLFLDEGDPETEIRPDFSDIPEMQEDQDKLHERVRKDWESGLIMLDEARVTIGMAELPDGNGQVFLKRMGYEFVGEDLEPIIPVPEPLSSTAHLAGSEVVDEDDEDDDGREPRKPETSDEDDTIDEDDDESEEL
jgi:HK97 family phage portal protein